MNVDPDATKSCPSGAGTLLFAAWCFVMGCSNPPAAAPTSQNVAARGGGVLPAQASVAGGIAPVSVGSVTVAGTAASVTPATSNGALPIAGSYSASAGKSSAGVAGASGHSSAGSWAGAVAQAGATAAVGGSVAAGGSTATAGSSGARSSATGAAEAKGCDSTRLLAVPEDPGAPGPWPVGAKTIQVMTSGGLERIEVWYPAQLGSEAGMTAASYDLSLNIPPADRMLIPAGENSPQPCNCYGELPIDKSHGPYPPVIFVHGLASFRTASLTTMTQWASRGFVVLAADHLGEWLLDFTSGLCGGGGSGASGDFNGDVDAELAALNAHTGDLAFLAESLDLSRVAIGGHSMGAGTVANASTKPNVQLIILLAELGGAPVAASSTLKSVLVMGGMVDTVTQWSADQSAYAGSPMPKRLVGITGGDHLDVTDICSQTNQAGETSIDVGVRHNVCALGIVNGLAHCGSMKDPKQGPAIVNYVSTAVLEQTLHCVDRSAALADAVVKEKFAAVGAYEHAP